MYICQRLQDHLFLGFRRCENKTCLSWWIGIISNSASGHTTYMYVESCHSLSQCAIYYVHVYALLLIKKWGFFSLKKRLENSILLSYKATIDRCNDDTFTVMAKYHIAGLSVLLACVGYVLSCTCPVPRPTNGCQADFCKLYFPWTTV